MSAGELVLADSSPAEPVILEPPISPESLQDVVAALTAEEEFLDRRADRDSKPPDVSQNKEITFRHTHCPLSNSDAFLPGPLLESGIRWAKLLSTPVLEAVESVLRDAQLLHVRPFKRFLPLGEKPR